MNQHFMLTNNNLSIRVVISQTSIQTEDWSLSIEWAFCLKLSYKMKAIKFIFFN